MTYCICKILKQEGFIRSYLVDIYEKDKIKIILKYKLNVEKVIKNIKQVSKSGIRKYCKYKSKLNVSNQIGINIFATC